MSAVLLFVTVSIAGGLGAIIRYGLQRLIPEPGTRMPRAVLLVNLAGSFIAGATLGLMNGGALSELAGTIILAGFCGGLTTFSTFSVETMDLFRVNASKAAYLNIIITVIGGVLLAVLGFVVTRSLV